MLPGTIDNTTTSLACSSTRLERECANAPFLDRDHQQLVHARIARSLRVLNLMARQGTIRIRTERSSHGMAWRARPWDRRTDWRHSSACAEACISDVRIYAGDGDL